jgi:hypothetical protein
MQALAKYTAEFNLFSQMPGSNLSFFFLKMSYPWIMELLVGFPTSKLLLGFPNINEDFLKYNFELQNPKELISFL